MTTKCPLCDRDCETRSLVGEYFHGDQITCKTCGTFNIERKVDELRLLAGEVWSTRRHLLSARTKSATTPAVITQNDLREWVKSMVEPSVARQLDLVLEYFGNRSEHFGDHVSSVLRDDYPLASCKNAWALTALIQELGRRGLLDVQETLALEDEPEQALTETTKDLAVVTGKGWENLQNKPPATSTTAFIAMAFRDETKALRVALEKAVRDSGFEPIVVDADLHNEGIVDRIFALIRQSRFVVADLTFNRGGVYYEAGFEGVKNFVYGDSPWVERFC